MTTSIEVLKTLILCWKRNIRYNLKYHMTHVIFYMFHPPLISSRLQGPITIQNDHLANWAASCTVTCPHLRSMKVSQDFTDKNIVRRPIVLGTVTYGFSVYRTNTTCQRVIIQDRKKLRKNIDTDFVYFHCIDWHHLLRHRKICINTNFPARHNVD